MINSVAEIFVEEALRPGCCFTILAILQQLFRRYQSNIQSGTCSNTVSIEDPNEGNKEQEIALAVQV